MGMLLPKTHYLMRVTIPTDVMWDLHIPKMLVTTGCGPKGGGHGGNEPYGYKGLGNGRLYIHRLWALVACSRSEHIYRA